MWNVLARDKSNGKRKQIFNEFGPTFTQRNPEIVEAYKGLLESCAVLDMAIYMNRTPGTIKEVQQDILSKVGELEKFKNWQHCSTRQEFYDMVRIRTITAHAREIKEAVLKKKDAPLHTRHTIRQKLISERNKSREMAALAAADALSY